VFAVQDEITEAIVAAIEQQLYVAENFHPALCYCGRWQEASEAAQRALRLSPRDPFSAIYHGVAAYAQFVGKNYSEAISLSREAVRLRGDFSGTYRVLTVAAGMVRQTEVATAALPAHDPDQTG